MLNPISKDMNNSYKLYKQMDKSLTYCKHCFAEGKLTILEANKDNEDFVEVCHIHNNLKSNFHILVFNENLNNWVDVRGCNIKKKPEIFKQKATCEGKCSICGKFNKTRDQNGRGKDCGCSQKWYKNHNSSTKMKEISRQSMLKIVNDKSPKYPCKKCGFLKTHPFCKCTKCGFDPHKGIYKCVKCNTVLNSPFQICPNCNYNPYNETQYYCKQCGNKISNPSQICEECNYNPHKDYSSGRKPVFIKKENQLLILLNNVYIPWEFYKKQFNNKAKSFSGVKTALDSINKIISNYSNEEKLFFELIPTYRKQNDVNAWENGSKQIFEQSLTDESIKWFVYIKLIITQDEQIIPIVVGKSGSLLVNNNGSDLNFSLREKDGPSRKLIKESNGYLDWYREEILILSLSNEKEAYKIEKYLHSYGLLSS